MRKSIGLNLNSDTFRRSFNREPFAFTHNLSELDLFQLDSLYALAEKYIGRPKDYMVAGSAPAPDTEFFAVTSFEQRFKPHEAIENLDRGAYRILLKRAEDYDPRYRELLDSLYHQVAALSQGREGEKLERLESGILISSASTITPFHFDPEINFFSQIAGEKIYHVYSPTVIAESELERFYIRNAVSIGQVDFEGRDPKREYVFTLGPGKGFHQPENSPHWVETRAELSISFAFVFETNLTRARGRTRSFNHYLRKLNCNPAPPGEHPAADALKANAMLVRRKVGKLLHR